MKKMIVMLIAAGSFLTVATQTSYASQSGPSESTRMLAANMPPAYVIIQRINREYDERIWRVQRDPFMPRFRKARVIRQLERERAFKIQRVRERYRDFHDRDRRYDRDRRWDDRNRNDRNRNNRDWNDRDDDRDWKK